MYYCLVSILEGKIRHIYGKSTNRELCISMADYINRIMCLFNNPIDYTDVLDKWNLLMDISSIKNMHFEGDEKEYTSCTLS